MELRVATATGLILGWGSWWLSRCWGETAHIVDLLLEAFVYGAERWLDPVALGRLGGALWQPLLCGVLAAGVALLLSPLACLWGSRRRNSHDPHPGSRCLGRQLGLQLTLNVLIWILVEVKSVAFEANLRDRPLLGLLLLGSLVLVSLVGGLIATWTRELGIALQRLLPAGCQSFLVRTSALLFPVAASALIGASLQAPAGRGAEIVESLAARPVDPPRVLLVGMDSANLAVIEPLLEAGALPHLKALLEAGCGGRLRAILPPFSPPVWTSIATGVRPARHGIEGFTLPVPGDWRSELISSSARRVPALWDVANAAGLPALALGWYASYPVSPLRGYQVGDRASVEGLAGRAHPDSLEPLLDGLIAELRADRELVEHLLGPFTGINPDEAKALAVLEEELLEDRLIFAVAESLLVRDDWRLGMVYVRTTDASQHLFWKYRLARTHPQWAARFWELDPAAVARRAATIDSIYAWTDRRIGRLRTLAGPRTTFLLVSDHGGGMRLGQTPNHNLNPLLRALGLQSGEPIDLSRSLVYERRDEMAFWSPKRKLHLSIAGREIGGRLDPREAIARRADISAILAGVQRSDGRPLLARIKELPFLPDDPLAADWSLRLAPGLTPELEILLPDGSRLAALEIAPPAEVSAFSGNHRMGGFCAASGPGIRHDPDWIHGLGVLDIAPTLAVLLGIPVADICEGRVARELLDPQWLAEYPPRRIASWGRRGEVATAAEGAADEVLRARLRALGYIQ